MVVAGVAGVTGLPPDAAAQRRIDGGTYENCMRRARADPDQGLETALAWQERGGGVADVTVGDMTLDRQNVHSAPPGDAEQFSEG